ncbi:MAG: TonB family protein [Pyrinomonadaceae bacterium]
MKKKFVLTTVVSLFLTAIAVSAQTAKPNYAGFWELDASKSVLPETMRIESMTMTVEQTENQLSIVGVSTRSAASKDGGKMMGTSVLAGGNGANTYNLDGKETTSDINNPMMSGKAVRQASITAGGILNLITTSNVSTQMGDFTLKTSDTWELLDEGKALKVTRYTETPRGATTAVLYFTKKSSDAAQTIGGSTTNGNGTLKPLSGGVLNGKATTLVKPEYPPAARAVKASGAVNVQVTIDEQGDVISASAVSGHPLLRQAAEEAARNSKFAPVMLSGVPVKVTGIIVYNFTP